jgi:DNA-binding NtrC family response regulator
MNSPTRPVVLCVDDEDSQLMLRKMLFEQAGFEFLGVQSGTEALKLFRARDVGVVVLDYWMSGMKGTEIAVEMKRQRPNVPIIVLSGFGWLPGEASLVNAWFQKGRMQPDELVREVRRLLDHSSDTQQNATA